MKEKISICVKRHKNLIKALIMALLPLMSAVLLCAVQGKTPGELSLLNSEWNDELFYYKQVEGILSHGFPRGYFGFNESFANHLSFAAWSPVLVFPWIIWGLLFGWNLMSPVYCNIFFMSLAVFIFVFLTKPTKKQMGLLTILYLSNLFLTRYMLSCMPEALCTGMAVIYLAICYSYRDEERKYKLFLLFFMVFLMTLMRPYMFLFILFPAYYSIRNHKWKGGICTLAVSFLSAAVYFWIGKNLSAEYFTPLFKTQWLSVFKDSGLAAGILNILREFKNQAVSLLFMLRDGLKYGMPSGVLFLEFLLVTAILSFYLLGKRKELKKQSVNGFLLLYCVGIFLAILLMYKLMEGSRHLVIFITMTVFSISLMDTRFYKKTVLTVLVFLILYQKLPDSLFYYKVPYRTEQKTEDYEYWENIMDEKMKLNLQDTPNFDNVVIWVLNDKVKEKEQLSEWQMLYALPEGFGISCCKPDYITEQFGRLKSGYLATVPGGAVEKKCVENGEELIGESRGLVLYRLRSSMRENPDS